MGEAKDKALKALGLDAGTGNKPETDELEQALEQVDNLDVRELLRARILKRTAELKAETRQIEAQTAGGKKPGDPGDNGSGSAAKTEAATLTGGTTVNKWNVINGKPMKDPDGPYDTFIQALQVAELQVGKKGDGLLDTIKALKELGLIGNKGGGGNDINQTMATRYLDLIEKGFPKASAGDSNELKVMRAELTSLRQEIAKASDPIEIGKKYMALKQSMVVAGFITEQGSTEESIESLREKNRHDEQMVIARAEAEAKLKNANTLADLPKRIGEGFISQFVGEDEGEGNKVEEKLPPGFTVMICDTCKHNIKIPPEAGDTIRCGHCGEVYTKKKTEATAEKS